MPSASPPAGTPTRHGPTHAPVQGLNRLPMEYVFCRMDWLFQKEEQEAQEEWHRIVCAVNDGYLRMRGKTIP